MSEHEIRGRVRLHIEDSVAHVILSRPEKHNGLDRDMMLALVEAAKLVRKDRSLRAVILRGDGDSFCAGLDFPAMTRNPVRLLGDFFKFGLSSRNLFQQVCWCWRQCPVPVIAVLHGRCYGGGVQIALGADFRFITPDCEVSIMEIKWGLVPDMTGTVTLRELVGIDVAKELTMTGRVIDGRQAHELGLVSHCEQDPMAAALALVDEIRARSPDAISATKRLFQDTWNLSPAQAFDLESQLQFRLLRGSNQREAMKANFERRAPQFKPRKG